MRWEYKTVERNLPNPNNEANWQYLQDILNNQGIERWEMVGFATAQRDESTILIFTFKRPLD